MASAAWSGRFDRRIDDIFTVQDDIAGMIAQNVDAAGWQAHSLARHVHDIARRGLLAVSRRTLSVEQASRRRRVAGARAFRTSVAIDPNFAPAHAASAGVYGTLGSWEFGVLPPADALARAKSARRALWSWIRSWLPAHGRWLHETCISTGTRMAHARISTWPLR